MFITQCSSLQSKRDTHILYFLRSDQRLPRFAKAFDGVLVLRRVATTPHVRNKTQVQMNPPLAGLNAVFAPMRVRLILIFIWSRWVHFADIALRAKPACFSVK